MFCIFPSSICGQKSIDKINIFLTKMALVVRIKDNTFCIRSIEIQETEFSIDRILQSVLLALTGIRIERGQVKIHRVRGLIGTFNKYRQAVVQQHAIIILLYRPFTVLKFVGIRPWRPVHDSRKTARLHLVARNNAVDILRYGSSSIMIDGLGSIVQIAIGIKSRCTRGYRVAEVAGDNATSGSTYRGITPIGSTNGYPVSEFLYYANTALCHIVITIMVVVGDVVLYRNIRLDNDTH